MPECAFCPSTAKLTLEHITSEWMNDLFPGENIHLREARGQVTQWKTRDEIDWKARVVCGDCNNGWMSDLENDHAKPVLTPLITGDATRMEITQQVARSIALWIFKTAVVLDQAHHRPYPWFPKDVREEFRTDRKMTSLVQMWICGVDGGRRHINLRSMYGAIKITPTYPVFSYICTGGIGNFAFQLCSFKHERMNTRLFPLPDFDQIAVPIWPQMPSGVTWPFSENLKGQEGLTGFLNRWSSIAHIPPLVE
jgi:hypothetical protein